MLLACSKVIIGSELFDKEEENDNHVYPRPYGKG
jgi:hypothetical protein